MNNVIKLLLLLYITTTVKGQEKNLSPAEIYKPYSRAIGYLHQAQQSLPENPVISQEIERVHSTLANLSLEILTGDNKDQFAYFELQRLVDKIIFYTNEDELDALLTEFYAHISAYQDKLITNQAQLTKIAQCIMSLSPKTFPVPNEIAKYKARHIRELYNYMGTDDWDYDQRLNFINVFVGQYAKMSNLSMSEKMYRQFDDLLVNDKQTTSIETFSIPQQITYMNGRLNFTDVSWNILKKNKIVISVEEEDLYHLVYLVNTLRTYDQAYKNEYDIVIVCDKDKISSNFIKAVKQNLAFDDFFIARVDQNWQENHLKMPIGLLVNKDNKVTYQADHISKIFKKLNTPLEKEYIKNETKRRKDLAKKKATQRQKAINKLDSIAYKEVYGNIVFTLKGLWQDNLETRLTPVEGENNPDMPYLAVFEVFNSQYQVFQELILVTGKEQNIDIYSDYQYQKRLTYKDQDNARFYEAIKAIDICLQEKQSYNYLHSIYPFQNGEFVERLKRIEEEAGIHIDVVTSEFDDKKIIAFLKKYTAQKTEMYKDMV